MLVSEKFCNWIIMRRKREPSERVKSILSRMNFRNAEPFPREWEVLRPVSLCLACLSESNSKPHFIMSHSFQAFGVLCQVGGYFFCVPVCARIHEGIVTSNRDRRTLIDKANEMLASVCRGQEFVLLADAYYANGKVIRSTKGRSGVLVTRVRRTTTGFRPAAVPRKRKRGRPKKYGAAVKLQNVFGTGGFSSVPSPVYGERNISVRFKSVDLLWKPAGAMVRFVLVDHPTRGRIILLSTDLTMEAQEIILLYSLRFKIEVAFKQAVHSVGSFGYHFWMAAMRPLKRRNGNQYLHRTTEKYRRQVQRKMHAYHVFVQTGMIAQGMLQYLAMTCDGLVLETLWNLDPNHPPRRAAFGNDCLSRLEKHAAWIFAPRRKRFSVPKIHP